MADEKRAQRGRYAPPEIEFAADVLAVLAASKFKHGKSGSKRRRTQAKASEATCGAVFHEWLAARPELEPLARVDGHCFVCDEFRGVDVLGTLQEHGVPNFRQVPGYPVYGCGQPTRRGLERVVAHLLAQDGVRRVLSVNMREEPALSLGPDGIVYSPRDPHHVIENLVDTGVLAHELEEKEAACKREILERAKRNDGQAVLFHDVFPEVGPAEPKLLPVDAETVLTIREMYDLQIKKTPELDFHRVPVTDETAPEEQDFDQLVGILRAADVQGTAFLFNCQMGRGRTTTAMVAGMLFLCARGGLPRPEAAAAAACPPFLETAAQALCKELEGGADRRRELDAVIDACGRMQAGGERAGPPAARRAGRAEHPGGGREGPRGGAGQGRPRARVLDAPGAGLSPPVPVPRLLRGLPARPPPRRAPARLPQLDVGAGRAEEGHPRRRRRRLTRRP